MNELLKGNPARRMRAWIEPHGLPSLSTAVAAILVLWVSAPILISLHPVWETDYYSHGYLALALTVVFFVIELRRAPSAPLTPSWIGLAALFFFLLVALAGLASATLVVAQSTLPVLWIAAVWALAGARTARRFVLPLAYLFVALPAWDFLIEPTRRLTVVVVSAWIRAAGMPAFIEGNLIHVPSGTFEVAGGCGGLKYILVSLALACALSLFQYRRWTPAIVLIGSALTLAFLGNWLRIFITVGAGLSPENPVSAFVQERHLLFGWGLFVVAIIVPLLAIDRVLQSRNPVPAVEQVPVVNPAPATSNRSVAIAMSAILVLAVWLDYRIADDADVAPTDTVDFAAPELAGWELIDEWNDDRIPVYVGASAQTAGWYANDSAEIGAYLAHYTNQRQDHEVVYAHNRPAGQSGSVLSQRAVVAAAASGSAIPFQELEVTDSDGQRRLVWVTFRVAGKPVANELVAKILQVVGAIRGRRDAQALVLTSACADDCAEAGARLAQFVMNDAAQSLYEAAERSM